jgi:hypothetical protein
VPKDVTEDNSVSIDLAKGSHNQGDTEVALTTMISVVLVVVKTVPVTECCASSSSGKY